MLVIYGIKSCDSCRNARKYLRENDIEHAFHDVREDGLDENLLRRWLQHLEWTTLLNRKSLTWRKIPEADRCDLDASRAVELIIGNPTLLKRPVIERDEFVAVGFSAADYDAYRRDGRIG